MRHEECSAAAAGLRLLMHPWPDKVPSHACKDTPNEARHDAMMMHVRRDGQLYLRGIAADDNVSY